MKSFHWAGLVEDEGLARVEPEACCNPAARRPTFFYPMSPRKSILWGIGAALVLLQIPAQAARPSAAEEWLTHYYENPQPERFVTSIYELSRSGYFEQPGHVPLAIGFIGSLFAQNPEQIDQWVVLCSGLPRAHQRLMASALWYSGSRKGVEYLQAYSRVVDPAMRAEIEQLLATKPSLRDADVHSTSSMNLQWGAFLATGESGHITKVLAALGSDDPGLSTSVRLALAEKAATHERVYQICQDELTRQTAEVRGQVQTALADVKAQP
jgi:hypothetical protein